MWCKILHQFRLSRTELNYQKRIGSILTKKNNNIAFFPVRKVIINIEMANKTFLEKCIISLYVNIMIKV